MKSISRLLLIVPMVAVALLAVPGAAFASTPTPFISVTNVKDAQFSLTWTSRFNETGDTVSVFQGSCSGPNVTSLSPPATVSADEGNGLVHYFDIGGLPPTPGAQTTLAAAVGTSDTSITVSNDVGFPASGNYTVVVDSEQMLVTGGQGTTTWTVSRAQNGTTAASHSSGALVSWSGTPSQFYYRASTADGNTYPSASTCYGPVTLGPQINPVYSGLPIGISGTLIDNCGGSNQAAVVQGVVTLFFKHVSGVGAGQYSTILSTTTNPSSSGTNAGTYTINTPVFVSGTTSPSYTAGTIASPAQLFQPRSGDTLFMSFDGGNMDYRPRTYLYNGSNPMTITSPLCDGPIPNLTNGGFDSGVSTPWQLPPSPATASIQNSVKQSGNYALEIQATAAGQYAWQNFSVQPSTQYLVSGCIEQNAPNGYITFRDADNNGNLLASITTTATVTTFSSSSFTCVSGTMRTSPTTRYIRIYTTMTAAGTYYFDSINVMSAKPTVAGYTNNVVVNGGFEYTPVVNGSYGYTLGWQLPAGGQGSVVAATASPLHFTGQGTGNNALYLNATAAGQYAVQTSISALPSHTYTFSGCIMQDTAKGILYVKDPDNNVVLAQLAPTGTGSSWQCTPSGGITFTTKSTTSRLWVYANMNAAGHYYYDDVSITG